jgi:non-heme chloroperoxidase
MVPTTVMAGRRSEMYPWPGQAVMADLIPGARMVTLEKSGHVPLIDQPLACIRTLGEAFELTPGLPAGC